MNAINYIPSEEYEQIKVVQYLEDIGATFTAIPNSTYTKSWSQKLKNKRTGLRAGFPDLVAIVDGKFMAIEMKRTKGGTLSAPQKEWIAALESAGVPVRVCKGHEEAIKFIEEMRTK